MHQWLALRHKDVQLEFFFSIIAAEQTENISKRSFL